MGHGTASFQVRLGAAFASSLVLFAAVLLLLPDALPLLPAIAVPIWVGFFPAHHADDPRTRRTLAVALAVGTAALVAGVAVLLVG